jgi:MFS family permease
MKQIYKIYLTEFLKTQRYFLPVIILFFQLHHLSYTQIFVIYAVRSLVIFLLEIPSGVLADQFGKKTTLIFSRASLLPVFVIFALADNFWMFLAAAVMEAFNRSFKSGTHKAYIYDFLLQEGYSESPSKVYGKSKFWARMGEALASLTGGFIAVQFGYPAVFWFALGPAVLNVINAVSYSGIEEDKIEKTSFRLAAYSNHIRDAVTEIKGNRVVQRLIINSAVFLGSLGAAVKFLQPYMEKADIPVEWFGIVYMGIMVLTAYSSRYAYRLERRVNRAQVANFSGWLVVIPLFILGTGFNSISGIALFIFLYICKHARRPAMITQLNEYISSGRRATILSADSLFRSLFQLMFLPVIGLLSDNVSIYAAMLMIGGILILNQIIFFIPSKNPLKANRQKT